MNNPLRVDVIQPFNNLTEKAPNFVLVLNTLIYDLNEALEELVNITTNVKVYLAKCFGSAILHLNIQNLGFFFAAGTHLRSSCWFNGFARLNDARFVFNTRWSLPS